MRHAYIRMCLCGLLSLNFLVYIKAGVGKVASPFTLSRFLLYFRQPYALMSEDELFHGDRDSFLMAEVISKVIFHGEDYHPGESGWTSCASVTANNLAKRAGRN